MIISRNKGMHNHTQPININVQTFDEVKIFKYFGDLIKGEN